MSGCDILHGLYRSRRIGQGLNSYRGFLNKVHSRFSAYQGQSVNVPHTPPLPTHYKKREMVSVIFVPYQSCQLPLILQKEVFRSVSQIVTVYSVFVC